MEDATSSSGDSECPTSPNPCERSPLFSPSTPQTPSRYSLSPLPYPCPDCSQPSSTWGSPQGSFSPESVITPSEMTPTHLTTSPVITSPDPLLSSPKLPDNTGSTLGHSPSFSPASPSPSSSPTTPLSPIRFPCYKTWPLFSSAQPPFSPDYTPSTPSAPPSPSMAPLSHSPTPPRQPLSNPDEEPSIHLPEQPSASRTNPPNPHKIDLALISQEDTVSLLTSLMKTWHLLERVRESFHRLQLPTQQGDYLEQLSTFFFPHNADEYTKWLIIGHTRKWLENCLHVQEISYTGLINSYIDQLNTIVIRTPITVWCAAYQEALDAVGEIETSTMINLLNIMPTTFWNQPTP